MPYLDPEGRPPSGPPESGLVGTVVFPMNYDGEISGPYYIWSGSRWIECNGAEFHKKDEYELWVAIGYLFGGSVEKFTFRVPDLRGAVG